MCTHIINGEFNYYTEHSRFYCVICDRDITNNVKKRDYNENKLGNKTVT